jgi:rhodanese-related sulfurtransferase
MKRTIALIFALLLVFALAGVASAGKVPTPESLEGGKIVSAEETKALVGNSGVHFFDMRKSINYGKGHIPGAVSTPYQWTKKGSDMHARTGSFDTSKLPADKNATVVFYSDGPTGWKSYKASETAIEAGYTNVRYFRGGFSTWTGKNMPVER